jgi:hypothetical protein
MIGVKYLMLNRLSESCNYPLSGEAEERVDQRSVVGVSRPGGHYRQCTSANVRRVDSPGRCFARPPSLHLRWKEGNFKSLHVSNYCI